ncbi:MAG: hypothetical protein F4Y03_17660 [Alphaproteobacteria bacterium]|nr:hypothetical protein [Alphaproteobacteria bacterium]
MERNWFGAKDRSSVEPALRLLEGAQGFRINFFHYKIATRQELDFRLAEWCESRFNNYPVLYFGFHGASGEIELNKSQTVDLEELAVAIGQTCEGRIIYFGSCSTLNVKRKRLDKFLEDTKALAVLGYKKEIDWLASTSLDLLVLGYLQRVSFTLHGMRKLDRILSDSAQTLRKKLGFQMYCRARR